jgi:hypothetical protein
MNADEWIREQLANAPKLNDDQRRRIARLLNEPIRREKVPKQRSA